MREFINNFKVSKGFTLVEILIAMAVGLVVLGALYGVFTMQNKTLSNQEQIVELQQNARAAMDLLTREISMAGYNPTNMSGTSSPRISAATVNSISFVVGDKDGGTTNITYDVYTSGGVKCLGRTVNGSKQPAVEHIESLNFTYLLNDGTETTTPTSAQLDSIVKVKVSVTAKSAKPDVNTGKYLTYTLTSEIVPRNLSLSGTNLAFSTTSTSSSSSTASSTTTTDSSSTTSTTSTTTDTSTSTESTTSTTSTDTTDTTATPTIISAGGSNCKKNADETVTVTFSSSDNINEVQCCFTGASSCSTMTYLSGNTYTVKVKNPNTSGFTFYFIITDTSNNVTQSSIYPCE